MERTEIDEELAIMRLKIKLFMSIKYYLSNIHPVNNNYLEDIFFLLAQKYNDDYDKLFITRLNSNIFLNTTAVNDEQKLRFISTFIYQYKKDKYDLLRDLLNSVCVDFYF